MSAFVVCVDSNDITSCSYSVGVVCFCRVSSPRLVVLLLHCLHLQRIGPGGVAALPERISGCGAGCVWTGCVHVGPLWSH